MSRITAARRAGTGVYYTMRYGVAVYPIPKFRTYRGAPPRCTTHYEREKAMKIISVYIKENWTADEIRENIGARFL